jgi:hypothetical protein
MFIHYEDRAIVADGRRYPHDGTRQGRSAAISQAEQDAARLDAALKERSLRERGVAPTLQELRRRTYDLPETRGPHEISCDKLVAAGAQFNPYTARIAAIKAQRIQSPELPALEAKAAAWSPPTPVEPTPEASPFATAIADLLSKPGHTPEDRARTDRLVARLRDAETGWQQQQAREAETKARAERPEFSNALKNARAVHDEAVLMGTAPESFVQGAASRLKALEATGDVDAYWRDARAAEAALNAHYDSKEAEFKKRETETAAEKAAALSRLPVAPPAVEDPPKSAIEQALTPPVPKDLYAAAQERMSFAHQNKPADKPAEGQQP